MAAKPERVDVAELRRDLAKYLAQVRVGEEILVYDREQAIARIMPVDLSDDTARLAEEGKLRLPSKPWNIDEILATPGPDIEVEKMLEALDWVRGER